MATLDIILLCCFIPGIIRGLSKGFLEQALALAGIVVSVWAAFKFSTLVCTWLKPYLNISETTLNIVSFALILIVISLLVVLVAKLLTKVAELAMLGWLDKTLGLVFALAVNALVIGVRSPGRIRRLHEPPGPELSGLPLSEILLFQAVAAWPASSSLKHRPPSSPPPSPRTAS